MRNLNGSKHYNVFTLVDVSGFVADSNVMIDWTSGIL